MKVLKFLGFSLLGTFGIIVFAVSFLWWAYDVSYDDSLGASYHLQVYPEPKTRAQLVVITFSDFHGDSNYYVGVRASKSEPWRPFFHISALSPHQNQDWVPSNIGWSGDGSVVALGDNARDFVWRDGGPNSFQASDGFRAAYDLRSAKRYHPTPQMSKGASQQIAKLIQSRGGWRLNNTAIGNRSLGSWRWEDADFKQLVKKFRKD